MVDDLKSIKSMAKAITPVVNIGKNGISDSVINQIRNAFRNKTLIKIKFLKSSLLSHDKSMLAQRIADSTGSKIISLIGNKLVLYKEKGKKK